MAGAQQTRPPAVAGQFYDADPEDLLRQIEDCYRYPIGPGSLPRVDPKPLAKTLGLVLPHAGYIYSGPIAAHGLSVLADRGTPEVAVIIGPNHWGSGPDIALPQEQRWRTPLGESTVEEGLVGKALELIPRARRSLEAHRHEHSIEVEVPFLQHLYGEGLPLLPIAMARQDLETSLELGRGLSRVLEGRRGVVVASSDLSHYYPQQMANSLDRMLLDAILTMSPSDIAKAVTEHGLSICGPGPVMAMLEACRLLGAREARLLAYGTSGDISGDYGSVVGYAAILVE